jgi:NAD(P)-dependent dehydrogenase (short-subunit alcohol dehydrogenase family)
MGAKIARVALAAGNAVVATGRNPEAVTAALASHHHSLTAGGLSGCGPTGRTKAPALPPGLRCDVVRYD